MRKRPAAPPELILDSFNRTDAHDQEEARRIGDYRQQQIELELRLARDRLAAVNRAIRELELYSCTAAARLTRANRTAYTRGAAPATPRTAHTSSSTLGITPSSRNSNSAPAASSSRTQDTDAQRRPQKSPTEPPPLAA